MEWETERGTPRKGKDQERRTGLTDVLEDVDHEEGRDEVVDALDVAAGRVADGPDEEDTLEDLHTHTHTHTFNLA